MSYILAIFLYFVQKYKTLATKKEIGLKGENHAANYLISLGYVLLERNWRFSHAEIDIIAKDGEILVFVEVKSVAG